MERAATIIFLMFLCGVTLAACEVTCADGRDVSATDKNALERAALYRSPDFNALPLDAWTENLRLERFIRESVKNDGIDSLARYGMQCTPSSQETGCSDCFTCTKTFRDFRFGMASGLPIYVESYQCEDHGEILIRAEIGPSDRIIAMTYWRTTPQGRKPYVRKPS